jgi:hypothetical protein
MPWVGWHVWLILIQLMLITCGNFRNFQDQKCLSNPATPGSPFICLQDTASFHMFVRFEVHTSVIMKNTAFWVVMPCGLESIYKEAERFSLFCTMLQHRRLTICTFVQNICGGHDMWLPVLLSLKPVEPVLHPWNIWLILHLRKDIKITWCEIRRNILGITVTCVASCCCTSSHILGHLRWFASSPVIIFQGSLDCHLLLLRSLLIPWDHYIAPASAFLVQCVGRCDAYSDPYWGLSCNDSWSLLYSLSTERTGKTTSNSYSIVSRYTAIT